MTPKIAVSQPRWHFFYRLVRARKKVMFGLFRKRENPDREGLRQDFARVTTKLGQAENLIQVERDMGTEPGFFYPPASWGSVPIHAIFCQTLALGLFVKHSG